MAESLSKNKPVSQADYDAYIRKLVISYDNKLTEQKDRIFNLVDENKNISEQLSLYKGKDAQISKTLMIAVSKAKEIEDAAKLKYDMEIERLKLFHLKWVSYYTDIKNKLPVSDKMLSAESFLAEMDKILGLKSTIYAKNDDDAMAQFMDESKRLEDNKDIPVKGSTAASDEKIDKTLEDNIDMNEVLNPKNMPELKELIRQIETKK